MKNQYRRQRKALTNHNKYHNRSSNQNKIKKINKHNKIHKSQLIEKVLSICLSIYNQTQNKYFKR